MVLTFHKRIIIVLVLLYQVHRNSRAYNIESKQFVQWAQCELCDYIIKWKFILELNCAYDE